ncbi:terminase large subunit domain-containing protein [Caulobacter segnis]|uniref:Terminase n=1 Tax=Caulobacter segnis TaxID=88688 RepID=A0A2W5VPC2_9CAUL|nr:terminase family protein [Caulobacter segnis]PZR37165.1 MAG: terminase [Caulobacter segnis]
MAETNSNLDGVGLDPRRQARSLYWRGWGVTEIADELALKRPTVESWKQRDEWDKAPVMERLKEGLHTRLQMLIAKDKKSGHDFKEIDLLMRQVDRTVRYDKYMNGGTETDLNPNIAARNAAPKKEPKRGNHFTHDQVVKLREDLEGWCYPHQRDWLKSSSMRTRMILKARQIGATEFFAREALVTALETGRNKIFLSASKAQALNFRQKIVAWSFKVTGVKLTGDPMVITAEDEDGEAGDPAEFHFLGTNYRTAQGYTGDFIFDEFFWVHGFEQIEAVASAVATQKHFTKTYFSTPSSLSHEAYLKWTGADKNSQRAKNKKIEVDVSHRALKAGKLCDDKIWRQIVTVLDAAERGYDLIDIDEIRDDHTPDRFANLFMCEFIDDAEAVFPIAEILKHTVDAFERWTDVDFYGLAEVAAVSRGRERTWGEPRRPIGDAPVWIAYDPSDTGDSAGLVVVAPPQKTGDKFRVLQRFQLWGEDFEAQAELIRRLCASYNVTRIRIDATGVGRAVHQLVQAFFPTAEGVQFTADLKIDMVHKLQDTFRRGRIEIDTGATDLFAALVTIRRTITESGRRMTYESPRSATTGHGDLAWALLMALHLEALTAPLMAATAAKPSMEMS